MVRRMRQSGWMMCVALLLCVSSEALAAVTAQVDRYNISVDETINLTIEVNGDDQGQPDTTALLRDFEILSRNQSSSYSLINGAMSNKSTWFLMLRPRHAGTLIIPALAVDQKKTSAITIQVSKSAARQSPHSTPRGDLWIEMSAEPKTLRVQQQAIITVLIFQATALRQAQLSAPTSSHAIVIRLGDDKTYQTARDGRNWAVTERRFAVFPQQHGVINIAPVQLDGSVLLGRAAGFASPFQSTKPVRVRSNALILNVDAIPAQWPATTWLPAKHLQLLEDWPTGEFKVGDSITRTLTLLADGLNASQLPEISSLLPKHLKAYADKPVLTDSKTIDGMHSSRQEKLAILATQAGTFVLPAIDVVWWNSTSESMQTTTLPARTFKVIDAPITPNQKLTATQIESNQANPYPANAPVAQAASNGWKWLALISSLGWLLTIAWLLRQAYRRKHQSTSKPVPIDLSALQQAVLDACQTHQAKACEQALLHFATAQWPHNNPHNLTTLANHCDAPLAREVQALDRHLYANPNDVQDEATWPAKQFQTAFEQTDFSVAGLSSTTVKKALPSLYP